MKWHLIWLVVASSICLSLLGCGPRRLTPEEAAQRTAQELAEFNENWPKLHQGMPESEVVQLIPYFRRSNARVIASQGVDYKTNILESTYITRGMTTTFTWPFPPKFVL